MTRKPRTSERKSAPAPASAPASAPGPMLGLPPWLEAPLCRLTEAVQAGRLPSGVLLVGPEGVGKGWLARQFLQRVACTRADEALLPCGVCNGCRSYLGGTHSEILQVHPEEKGKEILVDAVREVIDFLSLSHSGPARLVFIEPAERMTSNAVNALLKTLEEPPAGAAIVLTAARPARLPATLRSRCQLLRIASPDRARVRQWLHGLPNQELAIDEALAASLERPMGALGLLEDPVAIAGWKQDRETLNALLASASPFPVIQGFMACDLATLFPRLQCLLVAAQYYLATGGHDDFGRLFPPERLEAFARARGLRELSRLLQDALRWQRQRAAALNPQLRCEDVVLRFWRRDA